MKLISHEKFYKYNSINIYLVALSYPFVHLYAIKTECIAMFFFFPCCFMVSPDLQTFLVSYNSTFDGKFQLRSNGPSASGTAKGT